MGGDPEGVKDPGFLPGDDKTLDGPGSSGAEISPLEAKPKVDKDEVKVMELLVEPEADLGAYQGVGNVDLEYGNKPGTATLWKTGIEGIVVCIIVPRRLQYITTDKDGIFINLYARSDS